MPAQLSSFMALKGGRMERMRCSKHSGENYMLLQFSATSQEAVYPHSLPSLVDF